MKYGKEKLIKCSVCNYPTSQTALGYGICYNCRKAKPGLENIASFRNRMNPEIMKQLKEDAINWVKDMRDYIDKPGGYVLPTGERILDVESTLDWIMFFFNIHPHELK